jgi:hypothetical protein
VDIEGNRATAANTGVGGGIYVNTGVVELTGGCTLKDNFAAVVGGGNGVCLGNGALIEDAGNDIEDDIVNDPT